MIEVCSEKEKLVGMAVSKTRSRLLLFTSSVFQLYFFSERAGLESNSNSDTMHFELSDSKTDSDSRAKSLRQETWKALILRSGD